ncbi:B-cell receptor-associated protein 31 [Halyomorpha halys]|uniref:B-cell receptor-associated protein 31 n=1 Tax=Halyomorpha halys TaxID=286706 RepID=UPI0006D51076|nr:B-cell receptor-associated protein 31 [Halyomorpha halys]
MSIQWTLVATFLYAEIALVLLFVLPLISARRWNSLLKSRFLQVLSRQALWYFGLIVLVLVLFLLDSIREMRKYSSMEPHEHSHLENELQISMRLFRAQRNFYISGFSLFLTLVIRRFVQLISKQAELSAENEAALKQAKSATAAARSFMQGSGEDAQNSSNEAHQKELNKLTEKIESQEQEIDRLKKDKEAVISQAKSLETEYDRLSEEHNKLQLKLKVEEESVKDK